MAGQKRVKTKYTGIYKNEDTGKYDVKFNFKVYDPKSKKNLYKAKWRYGLKTISEARRVLAAMQAGGEKKQDTDITLQGAYDLWEMNLKATARGGGSPVTVANTKCQLKMIAQFLPLDTKMKNIDEDVYLKFCADIRAHHYSEETLSSLNACMRKLISLCYRKKLIAENPLDYVDNMKLQSKQDYEIISTDEYKLLEDFFERDTFARLGVCNGTTYKLLVATLFYTGARIGEALALTPEDYDLKERKLTITKAFLSDEKLTKSPKNFKHRSIPIPERLAEIAEEVLKEKEKGTRVFPFTHGAASARIKTACEKVGIKSYTCHSFRHHYCSILLLKGVPLNIVAAVSGDTMETLIKRYLHLLGGVDGRVLDVMDNL